MTARNPDSGRIDIVGVDPASHRTGLARVTLSPGHAICLVGSTTIVSACRHHVSRAIEMQQLLREFAECASDCENSGRIGDKTIYSIEWHGSYMRTAPPKLIEAVAIIVAPILLHHDRFVLIRPQGWKRRGEEKADTMRIAEQLGAERGGTETKACYSDRCDAVVIAWRTAVFIDTFRTAGRTVDQCVRLARGRKSILIADNERIQTRKEPL